MDQRRLPDEPEILDSAPFGPRRWVWALVIIGCCILIVIGLVVQADRGDARSGSSPSPSASDPPPAADGNGEPSFGTAEEVSAAHLEWLAATTDYDVFLRSSAGVVRIMPRSGRVVRTSVPGLLSSGPVTFQPIADGVLIRPLDAVPGYGVPDAAPVTTFATRGGLLFPGPDDEHVWVEHDSGELRLVAVRAADGLGRTAARVTVPSGVYWWIGDGHGYLLRISDNGIYHVTPAGSRHVRIGRPIAVGPTRLLGVPAACVSSCRLTELGSDFRRTADQPTATVDVDPNAVGVVSPDGRTAAIISTDRTVTLIDLRTETVARVRLLRDPGAGGLAFSPDSRWLFGVGDDHLAYAVDVRTADAHRLLAETSGVQQVAVRS